MQTSRKEGLLAFSLWQYPCLFDGDYIKEQKSGWPVFAPVTQRAQRYTLILLLHFNNTRG